MHDCPKTNIFLNRLGVSKTTFNVYFDFPKNLNVAFSRINDPKKATNLRSMQYYKSFHGVISPFNFPSFYPLSTKKTVKNNRITLLSFILYQIKRKTKPQPI